jgi:hypothetical protein
MHLVRVTSVAEDSDYLALKLWAARLLRDAALPQKQIGRQRDCH